MRRGSARISSPDQRLKILSLTFLRLLNVIHFVLYGRVRHSPVVRPGARYRRSTTAPCASHYASEASRFSPCQRAAQEYGGRIGYCKRQAPVCTKFDSDPGNAAPATLQTRRPRCRLAHHLPDPITGLVEAERPSRLPQRLQAIPRKAGWQAAIKRRVQLEVDQRTVGCLIGAAMKNLKTLAISAVGLVLVLLATGISDGVDHQTVRHFFVKEAQAQRVSDSEIETVLRTVTEQMNKQLPQTIDRETRLDGTISGPGRRFQYLYTMLNHDVSGIDVPAFELQIRQHLTNGVCTNPAMKVFMDNDVDMVYSYRDRSSRHITSVSVKRENCGAQ